MIGVVDFLILVAWRGFTVCVACLVYCVVVYLILGACCVQFAVFGVIVVC